MVTYGQLTEAGVTTRSAAALTGVSRATANRAHHLPRVARRYRHTRLRIQREVLPDSWNPGSDCRSISNGRI